MLTKSTFGEYGPPEQSSATPDIGQLDGCDAELFSMQGCNAKPPGGWVDNEDLDWSNSLYVEIVMPDSVDYV